MKTNNKSRNVTKERFTGYFASPLRYPGGKGRLGPWLANVIEKNGLKKGWYVEPYAGGAGAALYLLLQNHVDHIVINDADPLIYAFWQSVVNDSDEFIQLIRTTPVTMDYRERYQEIVKNPTEHSQLELGFAAFFLNRTSRSGILTGGVIGGKNQNGEYKLDARYQRDDLISRVQTIGKKRDQISVVGMDALDLVMDCSPGFPEKTLIYMDPPYYEKGSQLYLHHYKHEDHQEIADWVSKIDHPLLITYDNCSEVRKLYPDMNATEFSLKYSTHLTRPLASEVLFYANLQIPSVPQLTRGAQLPRQSQSR